MKVYFTVKTGCSYIVCKKTTCESTLPWLHIVMCGIIVVCITVGLSRRSQKRDFKNSPKSYNAVGNEEKRIVSHNTLLKKR